VAATNLANADATQPKEGHPYLPQRVIAKPATNFDSMLSDRTSALSLRGTGSVVVQSVNAPPRMEHDPGNPAADAQGMVAVPAINAVEETMTLMTAVRAYEADVRAVNAAKTMAMKALEIGSSNA
jgi:flagellar basal-body rod protein FlgC